MALLKFGFMMNIGSLLVEFSLRMYPPHEEGNNCNEILTMNIRKR